MTPRPLLASLLFAFVAASGHAQDVRLYRAGDTVDPREVAAILDAPKPIKMRSLRLLDEPVATPSAVAAATVAATALPYAEAAPSEPRVRPSALSLPVQFAFDSADILPGARGQLDALAQGIRLLPAQQAVVIEGHTDARGSDAYNDQLSLKRAYAVKRYLVAMHSIDPGRLRAVGMGEYAPLPGRDPLAPENRRVQFRGE